MHKAMILLAGVVGFILGSRAGRQPYEKLEGQIRRIRTKPQVQEFVDTVKDEANERKSDLTDKVKSKADDVKSRVASSDYPGSEPERPAAAAV